MENLPKTQNQSNSVKTGLQSAKFVPGPVKIFRGGELAVLFIKTMLRRARWAWGL